jgi:hypothetical protein
MKFYFFVVVFVSLFIIGCSSTYRISNFSSKEKFYEDFNKTAKDKNVKITLINDSSFSFNNAQIINDSIYSIEEDNIAINIKVDTSYIKEMSYNKFLTYASILLKDGEKYEAHNIQSHNDSIYFAYDTNIVKTIFISPIGRIKNISYKNHWLGVLLPSLLGTVSGIGVGFIIISVSAWSNTYGPPVVNIITIWPSIGLITGGIWGWLNGCTYTYEFSP